MPSGETFREKACGLASLGLLLGLALMIFGPVFETRPFEGDVLYMLAWADGTRAADLLRVDPQAYPEWRPLPYATVWLQYRWATIEHLWTYYLVQVLLWTACAWLVHRIVQVLSGSVAAGLVAAAIVLTSTQPISSIVLIEERQSAMACLFGLAAWLIVVRVEHRRPARLEWFGVFLLLLASALSKEYGLAFAGAMALYAFRDRPWTLPAAAIAASGVYAALRIGLAGGATAPFCEDQGYFFVGREVCFDRLDALAVTQGAYNIAATVVGSLLPGLFSDLGEISVSPRWLTVSVLLLAVATIGWAKGRKPVRIGMLAVGFNAALSMLLYRSRNQVVAVCAVGVAVGTGLPIAAAALHKLAPWPLIRIVGIATLLSIVSMRAVVTHRLVADRVEMASRPDVCGPDSPDLDGAFVRRVFLRYHVPVPDCLAADPLAGAP